MMPARGQRSRCPACGCTGGTQRTSVDHEGLERFTLRTCPRCAVAYVSDPPRDLGRYYAQDSGALMHTSPPRVVARARSLAMRREMRPLLDRLGPGSAVLDLGAGDGALVALLAELGHDARGADIYDPVQWRGPGAYQQVSTETHFPSPSPAVQAVVMRHVLEHVPSPRSTLEAIRGGSAELVLVVVPNADSAWSRRLGDAWYYWDPPRHLTHFTARGLRILAGRTGFRTAELRYKGIDELVASAHRANRIRRGPAAITSWTRPTGPLSAATSALAEPLGRGVICALLVRDDA